MDPVVSLTTGRVRGRTSDGVSAFLAIPYAAAPVGAARFEAPRPAASWDGVREATALGATATQAPYPPPIAAILGTTILPGDDHLHVNVWTPDPSASGLPVMVWIHGGAFTRGGNALSIYDGSSFARDGVVLVSVNYRLGVPGFAVVEGAPSNRGLRDQLLALAWVQENVAAFGGDPGNVTVFGESAGGMSVACLLASPAADGLFRRAVVQSGMATAVADEADARRVTEAVAEAAGVPATAEGLGSTGPEALLEAQTGVGLALAQDPDPARWGATVVRNGLGIMSLFPTVDGDVVPEVPLARIAAGAGSGVELLAGTTRDEFRFFLMPTGIAAMVSDAALPMVLGRYGIDPSVAQVYAASRPGASAGDLLAAILTDASFRRETVRLADAHTAAGGRTHVYEFDWQSGVPGLGACHALELPFVFDTLAGGGTLTGADAPQGLADEVHAAWVAFGTTGDPGWSEWDPSRRPVQVFDTPSSLVLDPRGEELAALGPASQVSAGG
ncbi:carboxylesterase/lipase family protein [Pedococcus sp. NPDC057267]|uniref:carboxylesterase/lipase family protein n=1 Tax=Pedococcus sp. NPDC057267 TaxID=3346077 RepID=UPI0036432827